MHDLQFVGVASVCGKVFYQYVPKLTPISAISAYTNSNNIEVITLVESATRVSFRCTSLLQLNLWFWAISNGFDFHA